MQSLDSQNVTEAIPQLLEGMVALGDKAREVIHSIGGNGHCPQISKELLEALIK